MNARTRAAAAAALAVAFGLISAGSASALITQPSQLNFGKQKSGTQSAPQEVDVGGGRCNPDIFDGMNIIPGACFPETTDIAVSGPFKITSNTCGGSLSSPGPTSIPSCSINVAFRPKVSGPAKGFLRITSSPSVRGVTLIGKGCRKVKTKSGKRKLSCSKPKKKKKR